MNEQPTSEKVLPYQLDWSWTTFNEKQIIDFVNKSYKTTLENKKKLLQSWNNNQLSSDEFLEYLDCLDPYELLISPMHPDLNGGFIQVLQMVASSNKVRTTAHEMGTKVETLKRGIYADMNFVTILESFDDKKLKQANKKLYHDWIDYYKYQGMLNNGKHYKKIIALQDTIIKLEQKFQSNISAYSKKVVCTLDDLQGIPSQKLSLFTKITKSSTTKYHVGTSYPEVDTVLAYAANSDIRKKVHENFRRRGGMNNIVILGKLTKLKDEYAKLLGFDNFIALTTSRNLTKTTSNLDSFLNTLTTGIQKQAQKELGQIKAFAKTKKYTNLNLWDTGYFTRQLKEQLFSINLEQQKEYFPLDHVLVTFFEMVKTYFDIEIKPFKGKWWNDEVYAYTVTDIKTKQLLGYFLLDLFPREGKYTHMCAIQPISAHFVKDGNKLARVPAVMTMVGNFTPPKKDMPSLLSFGELETLLHEFGHMMHGVCSQTQHLTQSGTNTCLDYVEVPSQFFEEFLSDKTIITKFSKHYKTGKSLPKKEVETIVSMRNWFESWAVYNQLASTYFDITIHKKPGVDILKTWKKLRKDFGLLPESSEYLFAAGFGHLASMYAGSYWSYLVSRAFAADCWGWVASSGKISKQKLLSFKKEILQTGSSRPERESLVAFLQRQPKADSLVKYLKS